MKTVEFPPNSLQSAKVWPISVPAYRALGEAGLIPRNTELLYGVVYQKMSTMTVPSWAPSPGAAVREVWFVPAPERQVEVHRRPANGRFAEGGTAQRRACRLRGGAGV